MSSFEFVSVLLSIVVSLALAHLLTAVARMLQAKDMKFSFLLAGWIGVALFDCIDFWFSLWAARDTATWSLGYIMLWLAAATSIYLFAWLVVPEGKLDGVGLRAYHYANRRKFLPLGRCCFNMRRSFSKCCDRRGRRVPTAQPGRQFSRRHVSAGCALLRPRVVGGIMRYSIIAFTLALAACAQPQPSSGPEAPVAEAVVEHTAPAGAYTLDKSHASLIIRVNHIGYSNFTARFENWDAALNLDPAAPESSSINVTIDPRSIESDNPPAGFIDIMRNDFLKSREFPQITFRSTRIERTGPNTARITGDLTLLGVTKPVTLEARFNGGYEGMALDPNARVGFSAQGAFNRSDFGMSYGLPPAGSTLGVGDRVELVIETEFSGPAWMPPPASAP